MSKIPKIIFSFWEGNQFTQLHALTMYSCALYNPDFKIIIYTTDDIVFEIQYGSNEHNFKYTNIYNINLLKNIPNLEFVNVNIHSEINFQGKLSPVWKSDIIRIFKLYEHGGIYIDFDILFINKIPEYLLNIKEDCGFNKYDNTVNNAFILSTKNCNFINKVKDEILLKFKSNNINYGALYGKGISYTNILDESLHDNNLDNNIINDIKSKYYDIVIYGSYHRGMPYYDLITQIYKKNEIILLCGEDCHKCNYRNWLNKGHYVFVREL